MQKIYLDSGFIKSQKSRFFNLSLNFYKIEDDTNYEYDPEYAPAYDYEGGEYVDYGPLVNPFADSAAIAVRARGQADVGSDGSRARPGAAGGGRPTGYNPYKPSGYQQSNRPVYQNGGRPTGQQRPTGQRPQYPKYPGKYPGKSPPGKSPQQPNRPQQYRPQGQNQPQAPNRPQYQPKKPPVKRPTTTKKTTTTTPEPTTTTQEPTTTIVTTTTEQVTTQAPATQPPAQPVVAGPGSGPGGPGGPGGDNQKLVLVGAD